jgi:hypothetical protein
MKMVIPYLLCLLAAGAAACGDNIKPGGEAQRPAREIVSGGARLRGGGVRMDVQVGRTFTQRPVRANGTAARSAAVVTP